MGLGNLPLRHPVNVAYEAATTDLDDGNMIDPFHLEAYGKTCVNYNRDIEIFPVLQAIFTKIYGECPYKSPTDMGVNMAGYCIFDDDAVCEASRQEIIRRYFAAMCLQKKAMGDSDSVYINELLMNRCDLRVNDRKVITAARAKAESTGMPAAAMELPDGKIITGKTSDLLGASSAMLLNALKYLAGLDDELLLISREIIEPIAELKVGHLGNRNPRLHTDEVLIALSICAVNDENAKKAFDMLPRLRNSEMHSSVILSQVDEGLLKKLGVNLTCEPIYQTKKLYHK